ncbi:Protein gts1 [Emydomyces testavorans]|uniref:Protein gts1 n=1 Tax=Emydomyces testavorans TaxID=2070801 RepID=A0AAF0DJ33_9EURO|nr:Protein gts1 [Emydomyces testavorans]
MSPTIFSCVICGYLIDGYGSSLWLKEFRAVYSNAECTFISGVGCYSDPGGGTWIAPSNSSMHWDDPDYDFPPHDELPVMRQSPENGRHGFVLHDSCWCLLQKFIEPDDVPIERLLSICKSLPFPIRGIGVCWGHNYGGLTTFDCKDHYPWEDRLTEQYNSSPTHAKENPYNIAEIPDLLILSSKYPQRPAETAPMAEGNDCFSIFSWEILEAISINLLVPDVLNLVRASRSFHPILTSQTFWASRFEPGNDRDFIFEKRNCREPRDWIMLYQLTSHASSPPGLKNRRRIWELIRTFASSLHSHLDETLKSSSSKLGIGDLEWCEAAGDIQPETVSNNRWRFDIGCILFRKQSAIIPSGLSRIAFSFTANSVTGIRLILNNHTDICLGYINNGDQLFLETAAVCGFILAIGPQGVQAVQVIDNNGHASRWFGSPGDAPVTERLRAFEVITALEVGLDGYKLVSIAAAGPRPMPCDRSLRATALWYPTVPNPELYLNDESFTGESPLTAGYQPLIWIHFGGPKGVYLESIKEICVTRLGSLCCIEFGYDTEDIPTGLRKLGRRKVTDFSRVTRFQIDGPAGEFINTISVSIERLDEEDVYRSYRHGKLSSFKITTNHGRSAHFKPEGLTVDEPTLVPLSMTPGTILTGLYASQHPEEGLVSLGAISEVVNNRKRKLEHNASNAVKSNMKTLRPRLDQSPKVVQEAIPYRLESINTTVHLGDLAHAMASALSKRQQARHERTLQQLIKAVPGNDRCADCQARNPARREEAADNEPKSMKQNGNTAVNKIYNPKNVKPPIPIDADEADSAMERFIRQKYESKILEDGRPKIPSREDPSYTAKPVEESPPPLPPKPSKRFGFGFRSSSSHSGSNKSSPRRESFGSISQSSTLPNNKPSRSLGFSLNDSNGSFESKLAVLRNMGFPDDKRNSTILRGLNGDVERTVDALVRLGEGPGPGSRSRTPVLKTPTSAQSHDPYDGFTPPTNSNNPFDKMGCSSLQSSAGISINRYESHSMTSSADEAENKKPTFYNPFGVQPSQPALAPAVEQSFQNSQASQPLFPNMTGGYPSQQVQAAFPRYQQSMTPPVTMAPQGGFAVSPGALNGNHNPFFQPSSIVDGAANGGYTSQSQNMSPTNPFFSQTTSQNNFQLQFPGSQQPAQTDRAPVAFQLQHTNTMPVLSNSSYTHHQQRREMPQSAPITPVHSTSVPFFQAQLPQQTQQYFQPQQPNRIDKSSILALYNFSKPPPTIPEQPQQQQPQPDVVPSRSQSNQQFETPFPLPSNNPVSSPQPLDTSSAGSRNPFVTAPKASATFTGASLVSDTMAQTGRTPYIRAHMSQESMDIGRAQSGRHSPDVFASLSARYG